MIVEQGDNVFFVHPVILSALTALGQSDYLKDKNKVILLILLNFLNSLDKKRFRSAKIYG